MPKAKKDFKKAKVKLGRSLKPATNATDTGFKSQKINVPKQNLSHESFNRTISLLKHQNSNVKKDALQKLIIALEIESILDNQELIWSSLLKLMVDADGPIRKILKKSWKIIFLAFINGSVSIKPFVTLISVHLSCALCHLNETVRLDALPLLTELIEFDLLDTTLTFKILNLLVMMLQNQSGKSDVKSSLTRSMSRNEVLLQIYNLMTLLYPDSMQLSWSKKEKRVKIKQDSNNLDLFQERLDSKTDGEYMTPLTDKIIPFLINYWIETAGFVFGSESIDYSVSLELLKNILKIMVILSKNKTSENIDSWKKSIQSHIANVFPIQAKNLSFKNQTAELAINEMNWYYCQLIASFESHSKLESTTIEPIVNYLLSFFRESSKKTVSLLEIDSIHSITWQILINPQIKNRNEILSELINFRTIDRANSIYQKQFEFITFIIKRKDLNFIYEEEALSHIVFKWICLLPRKLWELRLNHMVFTEQIIEFLVYMFQHNILNICSVTDVVEKIQLSIIPLFHVVSTNGDLFGPFISYSTETQQKLLNLLFYLPRIHSKLILSLVAALNHLSVDFKIASYFVNIVYNRRKSGRLNGENHLYPSICITLLTGYSSRELDELRKTAIEDQFYSTDLSLDAKSKLSGYANREILGREDYLRKRIQLSKSILFAFEPFLSEFPDIVNNLIASKMPFDSGLSLSIALVKLCTGKLTGFENLQKMISSVSENSEFKNLKDECMQIEFIPKLGI